MGFTRKEAEHLLTMPESMLEKLGLIADKSIIEHYVNDGDVESHDHFWSIDPNPNFKGFSDMWRKAEPQKSKYSALRFDVTRL